MKLQVAGASVQGSRHKKYNIPCQDAHAYMVMKNYVAACASDGLGSANLSQIGATEAVEIALKAIHRCPPVDDSGQAREIMLDVFKQVNHHLRCLADENGKEIRDYATTLICVVVYENFIVVAHIGDGAVVISHAGNLELIGVPQHGEYVNEVTPVTSETFMDSVQIVSKSVDVDCVAIFTDGLERLALDLAENKPFQPFFEPLFTAISSPVNDANLSSSLEIFLNSDRVCERTDDDKTLILIGKVHEETTHYPQNTETEHDHLSDSE